MFANFNSAMIQAQTKRTAIAEAQLQRFGNRWGSGFGGFGGGMVSIGRPAAPVGLGGALAYVTKPAVQTAQQTNIADLRAHLEQALALIK
jgi:hypothetical protein